jgi:intracellular sulfur oxidation DsrE/DsrF family protein
VNNGQVILIGSDFLGRGDQRLGSTLVTQFFRALARREEAELPATIIFLNAGVRLLIDGSPALTSLQELENREVTIIACRTSVEHFDLEDKLEVGDTLPMADLVEHLLGAAVISL